PISALISQYLDWHMLFWVSGALGGIGFVLVFTFVPVSTLRTGGRFDLPGAVGLALALSGIQLALTKGDTWGWRIPLSLELGAAGIVVLARWMLCLLLTPHPLIDIRVGTRRTVLLTTLASVMVGFAFLSCAVALPMLLEAPAGTVVGL